MSAQTAYVLLRAQNLRHSCCHSVFTACFLLFICRPLHCPARETIRIISARGCRLCCIVNASRLGTRSQPLLDSNRHPLLAYFNLTIKRLTLVVQSLTPLPLPPQTFGQLANVQDATAGKRFGQATKNSVRVFLMKNAKIQGCLDACSIDSSCKGELNLLTW